jgi:hypothetical protein
VGVYTMKGILNHLSGRRVVIGTLSGEGMEDQVVEGQIHGADRDVTGGYVQISMEMKRWALEKIDPICGGNETRSSGKPALDANRNRGAQ